MKCVAGRGLHLAGMLSASLDEVCASPVSKRRCRTGFVLRRLLSGCVGRGSRLASATPLAQNKGGMLCIFPKMAPRGQRELADIGSMGGLSAFLLVYRRPETFRNAACHRHSCTARTG